MPVTLKVDLEERLRSREPLRVELGCGPSKRPGFLGIDALELPGVDLVGDLVEALALLPDRGVSELAAHHVLEHLDDLDGTLRAVDRVLADDGVLRVSVPHFSNPLGWSDPTHRRAFGLYSFLYYCAPERQPLRRRVPTYALEPRFRVEELELGFRPARRDTSLASRVLTRLVNATPRMQERYEAHACWLLPCYEVRAVLRPDRAART